MKAKYDIKQIVKDLKTLPSAEFKNSYGEKFVLYSNGISIVMGGDEVNAMVKDSDKTGGLIPLFNEHFNIWSPLELYMLGQTIAELGEQHMSREDYEFIESITVSSIK